MKPRQEPFDNGACLELEAAEAASVAGSRNRCSLRLAPASVFIPRDRSLARAPRRADA